jgi:hypothetical protein
MEKRRRLFAYLAWQSLILGTAVALLRARRLARAALVEVPVER